MLRDSLNSALEARWTKPLIFALCLAPGLVMAWSWVRFGLGTDIIQVAVRRTGEWTLKLQLLTLAVTSTAGCIQWLGGILWRMLHSLIYASAILGYVHYCAITESSARPVALGGVLASLLILRLLPIKDS